MTRAKKFVDDGQKPEISISAEGDFGEMKKTETPSKSLRVGCPLKGCVLSCFVDASNAVDRVKHYVKAKMYAISSDTHQLQFLKLHHFKLERI